MTSTIELVFRRATKTWLSAMGVAICIGIFPQCDLIAQAGPTATWSDVSGSFKVQATFVEIEGGSVVLKNTQGKIIKVPLEKLSVASQLQARKLANPKAFEKLAAPPPTRVTPIAVGSTFDIGSSPYPRNPTVQQFLDTTLRELKAGQPKVIWHAMPPAMRQEVDALVVQAVRVAGEPLLKQIASITKASGKIMREKKQFIFAHPQVAALPATQLAELEANWPNLVLLTDAITSESVWSAGNFQSGRVGPWVCSLATALANPLIQLAKNAAARNTKSSSEGAMHGLLDVQYKIVRQSAEQATVVFMAHNGNPSPEQEWRFVDGTWLPAPVADNWQSALAGAKTHLASLTPQQTAQTRTSVTLGLATLGGIVGSLANASTQEEFDSAVEQIASMVPATPMIPGGPAGPGGPGPNRNRPGRNSVQ